MGISGPMSFLGGCGVSISGPRSLRGRGMSRGVGTHPPTRATTTRTVGKRVVRILLECFLVLIAKTLVKFHPLFLFVLISWFIHVWRPPPVVAEQIPFRPNYDRTEQKLLLEKMFLNTATAVKLITRGHTHIGPCLRMTSFANLQINIHALVELETPCSCYRPQRSWGKVIFSEACVNNSVHRGGMRGCMHGCTGGACMVLFGGACVVLFGGVHGFIWGACVVLFGGCAWFYSGGMRGFIQQGGACVVFSVFLDTMRYSQ